MVEFKELTIEDKNIFENYLEKFNTQVSELSFTNLFIWREKYGFSYSIIDDFLWILNETKDGRWYFSPPIGDYTLDLEKSIRTLKTYLEKSDRDLIIKKASKNVLTKLKAIDQLQLDYQENRDAFDYVYDFQELIALEGNDFHSKKNHVNQFLKKYDQWSYESITLENIYECKEMQRRWCAKRNCLNIEGLMYEDKAIDEAVYYYKELDFEGGLIRINGQVEAFTFSERLNDETLVIHIEKANTDYHGLYNMINQQHLMNIDETYQYVNREQDLGIEGLRRAKLSYNPIKLMKKYIIEIK